jgi:ribosomal protein S18 acetylase RimI-like enzyme
MDPTQYSLGYFPTVETHLVDMSLETLFVYPKSMLVRRMRSEDSLAVATIHTLAWQKAYKGIVDQSFLDSIDIQKRAANWKRGTETNDPAIIRLVSGNESHIFGFACGLENRTKAELPDCDAELWAIYVHPDHMNQGFGKALVDQFKEELRSMEKARFCIWTLEANLQARRFYEKQGGRLTGFKEVKIGDQQLPEVGYEFVLSPGLPR